MGLAKHDSGTHIEPTTQRPPQLNAARAELRQAEERVAAGCAALEEAQAAARQEKERADGEVGVCVWCVADIRLTDACIRPFC